MDLRNLRTFIYVAELASFTRAANILGYSQSTVSFQIKQLETELGTRLFERINHTVTLTERGHEALQYAHQINELAREMESDLHSEKKITGCIRLAMADSLCSSLLGNSFIRFQRQYPGVSLKIMAAGTEEMFRLLNHNEADLVFTLDSHIYNTEYVIVQEEQIHAHFVAGTEFPLSLDESIPIQALMNQPFLLTENGMSYRRLMEEQLAALSLEVSPVLEIGNAEQLCRLVELGAGISFLPDYVTEKAVTEGKIVRLPVTDFEVSLWKQLLYHRDKWVSPAMQAVIEFFSGC